MKAAIYEEFQGPISIRSLPDPKPSPTGVVLELKACGICRSDWHGWMGNDPDIGLPHVPGHELSGVVIESGSDAGEWKRGERVTLPFVCGCGACEQCRSGNHQVCDRQFQPGFTAWGGFAQFVAIEYARHNLVRLPDELDLVTAATLGCRFATSFRAVADQARVAPGQWIAVWGCGGVGLSAAMIAAALGARVIAIDISDDKLELARRVGAEKLVNASDPNVVENIIEVSRGGVHSSIDAVGSPQILFDSIASLRKRGRHVQVGIMEAGKHRPSVPIDKLIGRELEIVGSHGMQAHRYPELLEMIVRRKLRPELLVGRRLSLDEAPDVLRAMNEPAGPGVAVIDRF